MQADLNETHLERREQLSELHRAFVPAEIKKEFEQKYHAKCWEVVGYKQQAYYWERQFQYVKSKQQEIELEWEARCKVLKTQRIELELSLTQEIETLKEKLRQREHQLFGKKTEKKTRQDKVQGKASDKEQKMRGQQKGKAGHGRRDYGHLPRVEESVELIEEDAQCHVCQHPYKKLGGTEDSEILEVINVRAYRRVIRRQQYKRSCVCVENPDPQILTPPPMERVIPKSKVGVTIWAHLLLNKYAYQQPLYRSLKQLAGYGLPLAMGTVTDGFRRLLPLFAPVYDAIVERSIGARHWHADETGWKVFETTADKKNARWYLWVFHNTETVVYKIAPSRSSEVLRKHFGENHKGGTLNVDRYSAYKVIAKAGLFILAFCWAHVRRDFLNYSKMNPSLEAWGLQWVERINSLYHINNQRIQHEPHSSLFQQYNRELKKELTQMQQLAETQQKDSTLCVAAKKILTSLEKHWVGLTVFVEHPQIPMDNNQAERSLRGSVIGRKNYYGSGSIWSSELAAVLFTLFETFKLAGINIHTWLLAYLQECAMSGGIPPASIQPFLPWNMTEKQKTLFSHPPKFENST